MDANVLNNQIAALVHGWSNRSLLNQCVTS